MRTISGSNSVGDSIEESIGQARNVLLNMNASYNPTAKAYEIKRYFEQNTDAGSILIFKGKSELLIEREQLGNVFVPYFIRLWNRKK